ncbi:hypothetical protein K2173_000706 [Erythroxylum novogranatense]|uniref:non-specific serine/threonine protein kinase n=1 Tax=Erythroxylum novogranatense TaxID=1862640 RepID=A0AAV8SID1_9ROSI|nr:hypothetical protein K2173_000706 [Erythroxylum novogranatense]
MYSLCLGFFFFYVISIKGVCILSKSIQSCMETRVLNSIFRKWRSQWIDLCDGCFEYSDESWTLSYLTNHAVLLVLTHCQGTSYELGLLIDLRSLRFGSNNFSGPLPSELGNLTKLRDCYLGGHFDSSRVSGEIPSTFAKLREMVTIDRKIPPFIGYWSKSQTFHDLSNGSSSLEFIRNLKSLTILNDNISASIPSSIGEYKNLAHLDLSFNNRNGGIPDSLFNLTSLLYLFLGNNRLNGTLPLWKFANLVANNFLIDPSNKGLNCLQRNFPCNRDSPRYSKFAIKCGGPQITSSTGTVYEMDNETLGAATYHVTDTHSWAVSNVGYFTGTNNSQHKISSSSQFTSLDSELFQTARVSASSLRYYGLGLENGNYSVTLQFAETAIPDDNTWKSLGKRVFDVYVQEDLWRFESTHSKGVYNSVVENYLEIHLFWVERELACILNTPPSSEKDRTGLIVGVVVGIGAASFLLTFVIFLVIRRIRRQTSYQNEELLGIDARPYTFCYSELKAATDDFHPTNKLGEGGFGPVYKERANLWRRLLYIWHANRNLVKLYGCCIEGDNRLLVYEYLENKSLDQALFGKGLILNWSTCFHICLGVARGLAYLHEESRVRIVHRDVKASNILIPKISDFGLAKLYDDKKTHISTRVAGTIGYLAPEYAMRGHLTEKADIFAFGVVALEIISGRPNANSSLEEDEMYLLEWAWHLHENNREVELVDSILTEFEEEELKRAVGVALLCPQTSPLLRPSMSRVIAMLSGDTEVSSVTTRLDTDNRNDQDNLTSLQTKTIMDGEFTKMVTKPMLHDIIGEGR